MRPIYSLILIGMSVVSLTSCDLFQNDCEKCEKAINHMCEKIVQNGCDPARMENAVEQIQDECGIFEASVYVGYMAETCNDLGKASCPNCAGSEEDGFPALGNIGREDFRLEISTGRYASSTDTFDLVISEGSTQRFVRLSEFALHIIIWDKLTFESSTFEFQLVRTWDQKVFLDEAVTFTFARGSNYYRLRGIRIEEVAGDYEMSFYAW